MKSMLLSTYSSSSKVWTEKSKLNEVHTAYVKTTTSKTLLVLTNKGNAYKCDSSKIPVCKWKEKGHRNFKGYKRIYAK